MAYVAVSGGEEAIEASLALLRSALNAPECNIQTETIIRALPELVDQVMSESSLYAPGLAALALKQGGGSVEEAVFLLRAFRSTLERPYCSRVIETADMQVKRRISAAFKDIPGGQILGITRDYSHRLLDFSLMDSPPSAQTAAGGEAPTARSLRGAAGDAAIHTSSAAATCNDGGVPGPADVSGGFQSLPKVAAYLAEQGLLAVCANDDSEPRDITMEPLSFPAPRSMRLQALSRGMTQGVMALGYAAIRGFGPAHPTVGELRYGSLDILIDHPFQPGGADDAYYVGNITVTEVESLFSVDAEGQQEEPQQEEPQPGGQPSAPHTIHIQTNQTASEKPPDAQAAHQPGNQPNGQPATSQAAANPLGGHQLEFGIGYGLVYGCSESKAIAMSVLDFCLSLGDSKFPTQDEEFVLYHIDGIEATGFLSHLKLPHYVTFQSKLNSARHTQAGHTQAGHTQAEHTQAGHRQEEDGAADAAAI